MTKLVSVYLLNGRPGATKAVRVSSLETQPVAGDQVYLHSGNAWRQVEVLATPRPTNKTIQVSGFRYKGGWSGQARRVDICRLYEVTK